MYTQTVILNILLSPWKPIFLHSGRVMTESEKLRGARGEVIKYFVIINCRLYILFYPDFHTCFKLKHMSRNSRQNTLNLC